MLEHHNRTRKRPFADPAHKYLEDLGNYKQAKTEPKIDPNSATPASVPTSKPEGDSFEDLEKEIPTFGKFDLRLLRKRSD